MTRARPPKIFFIVPNDSTLNVHGVLARHPHELDVVLLVAPRYSLKGLPTEVSLYELEAAKEGQPPPGRRPPRGVSGEVLDALAPSLYQTLLLIDRHNWTGASLMACTRVIHRFVPVWLDLLEYHRPDFVLFHDSPHLPFSQLLFSLARLRGIPAAMVLDTAIEGRLIVRTSVEAQDLRVARGADPVTIRPSRYITEVIPKQRQLTPMQKDLSLLRRVGLNKPGKLLRRLPRALTPHPDRFPSLVPDNPKAYLHRLLFNLSTARRIRSCLRLYSKHAVDGLPREPFVYYPLHFQPEATTLLLGRSLWEQVNNIHLLLDGLPENWRLVVKEHPQMLRYAKSWPRARDLTFYRELLSDPRIHLLPLHFSSQVAVRGSEIVATVSGTAGWEALQAEKPVITFGYPWYRSLPGVLHARSRSEVSRMLSRAKAGELAVDAAQVARALDRRLEEGSLVPGTWRDSLAPTDASERERLADEFGKSMLRLACMAADGTLRADS
ncbi:MAG: hypothetical protein ACLF0P_00145 [Thermoanaerobaculia bacterium]